MGELLGDDLHWRRVSHLGIREVAEKHQYRHRASVIESALFGDGGTKPNKLSISVIMSTKRAKFLDRVLLNLSRQSGVSFEVIFVASGPEWSRDQLDALKTLKNRNPSISKVSIFKDDGYLNLGDKLNLAVSHARGDIVCKMDDDDFYFDNYLRDVALTFESADNMTLSETKPSCYVRRRRFDCLEITKPSPLRQILYLADHQRHRSVFDHVRFPVSR
ncbi:glycosyltransferase [Sinorhizobium meliloti]|nr:glycosyltransferase [Sinorhizobium meliloti]